MAVAGYSRVQIGLHWVVAGLIAVNLVFEDWIKAGWRAIENGGAPVYDAGTLAHIGVGVAVLALALWRLGPALHARRAGPACRHVVAREAGRASGAWVALCADDRGAVVGLLAWFGASEDLAELHELGKPAFILLIAGHVAAALWHQFVKKDGLLLRMKRAG